MIDCVSVSNMRESDAWTIAHLVPSLELMHRAAYGVYLAAQWKGNISIIVGSGNNGGDGFALACILKEQGIDCQVLTVGTHLSPDSQYYAEKAKGLGVSVELFTAHLLQHCDMVVDCLLGTGFQGELKEPYRMAIEAINLSDAFTVSVDINSGMNGDTGPNGPAVRSDLTVTIGAVKPGLILPEAEAYVGRLVCADIGIVFQKTEGKICAPEEREVPLEAGVFRYLCPPWMDMELIRTY